MINSIVRVWSISLIFILLGSCSQTDKKSDLQAEDSTIVNSKSLKPVQHNLVLCPVCKGTNKCVDCGGTGVAIYYEGSTQQCVSCGGTGICQTCNTPEKQREIKKEYQSTIGTNNAESGHPRTMEQIQMDLDKSNKLLMVLKGNLSKFEENKESLDLQSQYRQIIIETEDQIQKLQQELSMVQ